MNIKFSSRKKEINYILDSNRKTEDFCSKDYAE